MRFAVRVLASTITVDLDDSVPEQTRDAILEQWAHLRTDEPGGGTDSVGVYGSEAAWTAARALGSSTVYASDSDVIPDELASRLTLLGLQGLFGQAFLLHAAGLATDDGSVIALVGPSGRGKTTASQALGQTMAYVSDETVAVEPDGTVIPYPKPLSIGRRPQPKTLLAPPRAGLTPARGPLRLAALVLLEREPERTDVVIEGVDLVDALGEIAPQSSSLAAIPSVLRVFSELVARTGGVRRVRYGDAAQLPMAVAEIVARRAEQPEAAETVRVPDPDDVESDLIHRAPFADAAMIGGRLVVLRQHDLHVLDGLGPAVWLAADGVTPRQLRDAVLSDVGDAPDGVDPATAIDEALRCLVGAGVLRGDPSPSDG